MTVLGSKWTINHVLSNSVRAMVCLHELQEGWGLQIGQNRRKGHGLKFTSHDTARVRMNEKPRVKQFILVKGVSGKLKGGGGALTRSKCTQGGQSKISIK